MLIFFMFMLVFGKSQSPGPALVVVSIYNYMLINVSSLLYEYIYLCLVLNFLN